MMQASVESYKGGPVVYIPRGGGQYWLSKSMGGFKARKTERVLSTTTCHDDPGTITIETKSTMSEPFLGTGLEIVILLQFSGYC
jgi:hypothetical protein